MEIVLELEPMTEFLSAIKSPLTIQGYEKDLKRFFDYLELKGEMKAQAREFTSRAKANPAFSY